MESKECPCRSCKRAAECNWTCDALNEWAEDKSFAQVAEEFINAYKHAEKQQQARRKRTA